MASCDRIMCLRIEIITSKTHGSFSARSMSTQLTSTYTIAEVPLFCFQDLTKDTMLTASNGEMFPALRVFALALRFFKEHALQQLSDQSGITVINDDVRWVITVPAIWKAPAKQFMRQAAYEVRHVGYFRSPELLLITC